MQSMTLLRPYFGLPWGRLLGAKGTTSKFKMVHYTITDIIFLLSILWYNF